MSYEQSLELLRKQYPNRIISLPNQEAHFLTSNIAQLTIDLLHDDWSLVDFATERSPDGKTTFHLVKNHNTYLVED